MVYGAAVVVHPVGKYRAGIHWKEAKPQNLRIARDRDVDEINVQGRVVPAPKLFLHLVVGDTASPEGVGGKGSVDVVEGYLMRAKGIVENFQLVLQLLILYGVNRGVVSKITACPILCPSTPVSPRGILIFLFSKRRKGKGKGNHIR